MKQLLDLLSCTHTGGLLRYTCMMFFICVYILRSLYVLLNC